MAKKGEARENAKRAYGTFVPDDGKIELMELDWVILAMLPKLGEKLGKYLPLVKSSADVKKELQDPNVSGTVVAGRLRWLRAAGYATPVKTVGGNSKGQGWQRTPEGDKALEEHGGTSA